MAETVDLGSDQFMTLLTDALRAGPASPQWHQAVQILRAQGESGEEYALLCRVRQHLESGKEYRSVRPGPGFTRKVMEAIEKEPTGGAAGVRWANWIAIVSACVIVAVAGIVAYFVLPGGDGARAAIERLSGTYWINVPGSVVFDGPVPPEWRKIGSLPVSGTRGLQPGEVPGGADGTFRGGGIVLDVPLSEEQDAAMEVSLRLSKLNDDQIVQAFVTDRPQFSETTGMSGHELVWLVQDGTAKVVLPDQRAGGQTQPVRESRQLYTVRLMLSPEAAVVESGGKRLWAGEHGLEAGKPRYVGVRFLRRGAERADEVVVRSIKIQRAQR